MEIWHRITFHSSEDVETIIQSLGVKTKRGPLPGGSYLIYIDIEESDPGWPTVSALVREKKAPDMHDTIFTDQEVLAAEWVRLMAVFTQGYPQPKGKWKEVTFDNLCTKCRKELKQKIPFHLAKEPHLGKHDFFSVYWSFNIFCTPRVLEALKENNIRGYEVWPAIIHRTNEPSRIVSQLIFPHVAGPALADEDKVQPEVCPKCGLIEYAYNKRGYLHFKRDGLRQDTDCQLTYEWFGSGGAVPLRETLISNRFARLIIDNGWKGVRLKPVKLI